MRVQYRTITTLIVAMFVTACASSGSDGTRRPGQNRDVLTQEQMREAGYTNVFEAVRALRSNWLTPRGPDSFSNPGQVQVYYDNTRLGGVETLSSIGTAQIAYVRYYDGIAATGRWGLDHGHGVIFVASMRN